MEELTITEVKSKRYKLANDIKDLINEFKESTGLNVEEVRLLNHNSWGQTIPNGSTYYRGENIIWNGNQ